MTNRPAPSAAVTPRLEAGLSRLLARPPQRLSLASLPTPVERAPWLDFESTQAWVKRDDQSSSTYGGGKVRKLEFVLANTPFAGPGPILSIGGIGSHHLLALALFLREQGRSLHALTFDTVPTPHIRRNLAVMVSVGTRFWHVRQRWQLPWAWLRYHGWAQPSTKGQYMTAGASTAFGCFGFVEAGLELAGQIASGQLPAPAKIFVTAGSAGTCAGLALGLALANVSTHLHLVSSVERWAFNNLMYRVKLHAAHQALLAHGLDPKLGRSTSDELLRRANLTWEIDHSQVGGGYGVPTPAAEAAVAQAREHGLELETTYTAKCVAAIRASEPSAGPVLFWHTHAGNDLRGLIDPNWEQRCPVPLPAELGPSTVQEPG